MRYRATLLTQVLAVNAVLVAVTALISAVVASANASGRRDAASGLLLVALAVLASSCSTRCCCATACEPLERARRARWTHVDLADPGTRAGRSGPRARSEALTTGFNAMLDRLEEERRAAGRAVLRAQESERQRIAQDLHDEVNQALTAIKLRLSAATHDAPESLKRELQETKHLVDPAMDELLHLARELRPTALDDHGLIPALRSQVADFADRTGIEAASTATGTCRQLSDEEQLVIYRVTQESLSNIVQHAGATRVDVDLSFTGATVLKIADDGARLRGAGQRRPPGAAAARAASASPACASARCWWAEASTSSPRPGQGTTIELTMGAT